MLDQLLAQQMGDNPQLQMLLSLMQTQNQADTSENKNDEMVSLQTKLEKSAAHIQRLREHIKAMEECIAVLENNQDNFAGAIGACAFCFGTDESCRACRGKGKPGAFIPDATLYAHYVAPVIRRHPQENIFSPLNS